MSEPKRRAPPTCALQLAGTARAAATTCCWQRELGEPLRAELPGGDLWRLLRLLVLYFEEIDFYLGYNLEILYDFDLVTYDLVIFDVYVVIFGYNLGVYDLKFDDGLNVVNYPLKYGINGCWKQTICW